jgi:TolB protein
MTMRSDGTGLEALISDAYDPAWRPEPNVLTAGPIKEAPPTVVASNPTASGRSFVSAALNTYPGNAFVTIRNRTANTGSVTASVAAGGFDPVPVTAKAGDEIVLSVLTQAGDSLDLTMVKVPPRRPPTVVRTSPSKGRTDVALTVQIEIVFTEPVNPATVNQSTFGVFRGETAVPGSIAVSSDGLSATFTPVNALERNTSYSVVATTGIRDLDGDPLEEQTASTFTTANPPSGTIAFVSERDGNAEIYTINVDGTGLRRLTNDAGKDVNPAWSPDGRLIAFSSDRDGSMKLYVMNADGSNVVRKTSGAGDNAAWSSDGKRIAYTGVGREYCCAIRIADASGDWSQSSAFSPDSTASSTDPSWSPDGSRVVFASDWNVYDGQQIFMMNSDGSGMRVLVKANADFSRYDAGELYAQPSWSPDGTKIAVVACHFAPHNCHPYSTVSIVSSDGSGLRMLRFAGGEARPAWSGDSQIIAFSSASCGVCRRTIRYAYVDGRAVENDVIVEDGYSPAWKP